MSLSPPWQWFLACSLLGAVLGPPAVMAQEAVARRPGPTGTLNNSLHIKADYRPSLVLKITATHAGAQQTNEGISLNFGNVDAIAGWDSPVGEEALVQDDEGAAYQARITVEVGIAGFSGATLTAGLHGSESLAKNVYEAEERTDFRRLKKLNRLSFGAQQTTLEGKIKPGWHTFQRQIVLHIPEKMPTKELQGTLTLTLSPD